MYTYKPLRDRQIRVLCLEPGAFGTELRASLETYEFGRVLNDGVWGEYDAISYVWGPASFPHTLNVDGSDSLPLTQTLYDALQHFRHRQGIQRLWADAICINQSDLIEKSSQVALMAEIYSTARNVRAFLGPAEDSDALAFATMSHYSEYGRRISTREPTRSQVLEAVEYLDHELRNNPECLCCRKPFHCHAEGLAVTGIHAFMRLLSRPWFSRLWVVQEVLCRLQGQTGYYITVRLYSGHHSVLFYEFRETFEMFRSGLAYCQQVLQLRERNIGGDTLETLRRMDPAVWLGCSADSPYLLWEGLCRLSERRCSDTRDRIYAVRSVLALEHFDDLRPDYTCSHQSLYTKVAQISLDSSNFPELDACEPQPWMCFALIGTESPQESTKPDPSWVPRVDNLSERSLRKIGWYQSLGLDQPHVQFLRVSDRFSHRSIPDSPTHVEVRGRCYATISDVFLDTTWPRIPDVDGLGVEDNGAACLTIARLYVDWYRCCHDHVSPILAESNMDHEKPFLSLFSLRMDNDEKRDNDEDPDESFDRLQSQILRMWDEDMRSGSPSILPHIKSMLPAIYGSYLQRIADDNQFVDRQRLLARMEGDGVHDVGWVPETSKPGDRMCVISGAPHPFVLRPDGLGGYKLLGDAHTVTLTLKQALGGCGDECPDGSLGHYYMSWNGADTDSNRRDIEDSKSRLPDQEMLELIDGLGWLRFT